MKTIKKSDFRIVEKSGLFRIEISEMGVWASTNISGSRLMYSRGNNLQSLINSLENLELFTPSPVFDNAKDAIKQVETWVEDTCTTYHYLND